MIELANSPNKKVTIANIPAINQCFFFIAV